MAEILAEKAQINMLLLTFPSLLSQCRIFEMSNMFDISDSGLSSLLPDQEQLNNCTDTTNLRRIWTNNRLQPKQGSGRALLVGGGC